jgi:4-hydroxybenzoyl-CoA reductase subunit beta
MMRLPRFDYHAPVTLAEAARLLAAPAGEAMVVAGGTDLLPNMKRGQQTPRALVSLRAIPGLSGIDANGAVTIGALTTLAAVGDDPRLQAECRALAEAARSVATPHLRNMGTIGGNLCLDTRCTYYDQTEEWRQAIGYCLKKSGTTCWVAPSSPRCLAVSSTDTAPALLALDASVALVSADGARTVAVGDLYRNDGIDYLQRRPNEILTAITIPRSSGWRSTYRKLRRRGAFDFPVASAAVAVAVDPDKVVTAARIVVGAVASSPLEAPKAAAALVGRRLEGEAIRDAAEAAYDVGRPMDNTDFELHWRKKMIRALVTDALQSLGG